MNRPFGSVRVCATCAAERVPDVPGTVRCVSCGAHDHGVIVRRLVVAVGAAVQCPDCQHETALQDAGSGLVECPTCDAAFVLVDPDVVP